MSVERLMTTLKHKCRGSIHGTNYNCAGRQAEDLVTEALSNISHIQYGASEPFSEADGLLHIDHYVLFTEVTYGAYRAILALLQCKLGHTTAKSPIIPREMLREFREERVFVKPLIVYIFGRPNSQDAVIDANEIVESIKYCIINKEDYFTVQIKYR